MTLIRPGCIAIEQLPAGIVKFRIGPERLIRTVSKRRVAGVKSPLPVKRHNGFTFAVKIINLRR